MDLKTFRLSQRAASKLGEALAEYLLAIEGENPKDREHRRCLLHDINDLLINCGPGAEVESFMLDRPRRLKGHLEACMRIPALVLAMELPKRLTRWLDSEPRRDHPDRQDWVEEGRFLLSGWRRRCRAPWQ